MDSSPNLSNQPQMKQSSNSSSNRAEKKQATNSSSSKGKKKKSANSSSKDAKKNQTNNPSPPFPCFPGTSLELIVASLLLTGKLRVDSVQLFRQATMIVGLTGKYITLDDLNNNNNNSNVDSMVKFLNENGNGTVDEIFHALKKKTNS
ncbi:hypothetical protein [Brevibacillus nitrificans]|uniref:hypothetical protein n=1 Tax=Brevibacillus nitrificans TaxID=651560 RepID=UPI00285DCE9D|nr:hypothetical protein [Brevibacillus nitrificans]MDR7314439.1 hypothetical protein [Brevibacillus nitrificans]